MGLQLELSLEELLLYEKLFLAEVSFLGRLSVDGVVGKQLRRLDDCVDVDAATDGRLLNDVDVKVMV